MATDVPRADRVADVAALRAQGLTHQRIADRLGISRSYVRDLIYDPTGAKGLARKASYAGVCERCGGPTSGSNGRAKAPRLCITCTDALREPPHGSVNRYTSGKWACRCKECTAANTAYNRTLKGRPAPTHGLSGYRNYGCRCDICRKAGSDANFLSGDARTRRARRRPNPLQTL